MAKDTPLKSAYELAMERLREQDRRDGVERGAPLSAEQKDQIAEARRAAKAKLAELEILYRDRRSATAGDPDKLRELDEHYEIDRRRVESDLEAAIRRVRDS